MTLSRLLYFLFILGKVLGGVLKLPYYLAADHRRVSPRLRVIVDELINLELHFRRPLRLISFAELGELTGRRTAPIELLLGDRFGNVSLLESVALAYLVRAIQPRTIFEIGTYDGFSTYHLAKNSDENAVVYTLNLPVNGEAAADLPRYSLTEYHGDNLTHAELRRRGLGAVYRNSDVAGKVVQLLGDSLRFDYTPFVGRVDLVFIDGGHSWEHVRSDTENAFRMLSPRGVIVWHDFNTQHRDIYRFLRGLGREHVIYRVLDTRLAVYFRRTPGAPAADADGRGR